jgi:heme/copper-type cytochrome/quinol oxidase subunit 3
MTPKPEQTNETLTSGTPRRRWPVSWYVGMPMMIFGIVTTTMFSMRQYKESNLGHTYYEFIIPGVVLAVAGFILLVRSRTRKQL